MAVDAFERCGTHHAGAESDASASDDDGRTATATTTTTSDAMQASRIASASAPTATTRVDAARVRRVASGPSFAALRAAQGADAGTLHRCRTTIGSTGASDAVAIAIRARE